MRVRTLRQEGATTSVYQAAEWARLARMDRSWIRHCSCKETQICIKPRFDGSPEQFNQCRDGEDGSVRRVLIEGNVRSTSVEG